MFKLTLVHTHKEELNDQIYFFVLLTISTALTLSTSSALASDFKDVKIEAQKLTDSVYMMTGAGGNIGVNIGPDGTLIIDDQFAPLTEKIEVALKAKW